MNEEDEEFLRQLAELEKMLEPMPVALNEYRLYYDTPTGNPFCFAMEDHPGSAYIVVSKEDYERNAINEIKVINGRLYYMKVDAHNKVRYVVSNNGLPTLKNDIQFVVDDEYVGDVTNWKLDDGNH
jgi:hypothetical protein